MSRELLQQALDYIEKADPTPEDFADICDSLNAELAKPAPEPSHCVLAFTDSSDTENLLLTKYPPAASLLIAWHVKTKLYTAPSALEGMTLRPIEPTEAMLIAGIECDAWDALSTAAVKHGGWPYSCKQSSELVAAVYRAMIAAQETP